MRIRLSIAQKLSLTFLVPCLLSVVGGTYGWFRLRELGTEFHSREELDLKLELEVVAFNRAVLNVALLVRQCPVCVGLLPEVARDASSEILRQLSERASRCDQCHRERQVPIETEREVLAVSQAVQAMVSASDPSSVAAPRAAASAAIDELVPGIDRMAHLQQNRVRSHSYSETDRLLAAATRNFTLVFAGVFLLAVIVAIALARGFSRPINRLIETARRIGDGDLGARTEIPPDKDLAALATTLNESAARLSRHTEERVAASVAKERAVILEERYRELELLHRELKETQGRLVEHERLAAVGQLAAGVAHEINNPNAFVLANLFQLKQSLPVLREVLDAYRNALNETSAGEVRRRVRAREQELDFESLERDLPEIVDESLEGAERIKAIVADMKLFSRGEDLKWELVNVNGVLESALNVVAHELKDRARIEKDLADVPAILAGGGRLARVFLNLLVNAAHAFSPGMEEHNKVRISTRVEGETVVVRISDTGCGISPENQKRLFQPFFTTKAKGLGTGLGLAISAEIVRQLGGTILVDSAVGRGSTFTVQLPLHKESAETDDPNHKLGV